MKATKAEMKTMRAIANVMGCTPSQIMGDLPPLGGEGEVSVNIEGWKNDGEGIAVTEQLFLNFKRLPSGRLGEWEMESYDSDETSPTFGSVSRSSGKGQWR